VLPARPQGVRELLSHGDDILFLAQTFIPASHRFRMNEKLGTPVAVFTCSKELDMKITRAARTILSVTALAWAIPFAQAENKEEPLLSAAEVRNIREYAGCGANDSAITGKVKAALLREPELKSLDVSVETFKGEVLLAGFVKDEGQRAKAVKAASAVAGVSGVKNSLAVRN
jgi:hypothetical protein